jgi:hypothetical protein
MTASSGAAGTSGSGGAPTRGVSTGVSSGGPATAGLAARGPAAGGPATRGPGAGGSYGVGIGWRPKIAGFVAALPGLRLTEVIAESVPASGPVPAPLAALRTPAPRSSRTA